MSRIECPECGCALNVNATPSVDLQMTFLGTINCEPPGRLPHQFPFKFRAGTGRNNDIAILPAPHSVDALAARVPGHDSRVGEILNENGREDLIQDIEEAVVAKQWELFKASVVVCRRIVQIALCDRLKGHESEELKSAVQSYNPKLTIDSLDGLTLGPLLGIEERLKSPGVLSLLQRQTARRILDIGNSGAHRKVELDAHEVDTCIREAVITAASLVNGMQPAPNSASQPAAQSEQSNSRQ